MRRPVFVAICSCALTICGALVLFGVLGRGARRAWDVKRQELLVAARRAQPILDALEAYRGEHGRYPGVLRDLEPRYLDTIPAPGEPFIGEWHYRPGLYWMGEGTDATHNAGARTQRLDDEDAAEESVYLLFAEVPMEYCPVMIGGLHFRDRFAYRPDRRYPENALGGVLERVGDWAYYHE